MKFIELAERRSSIRGFKPDPIPDALLNEILQAGNLAPTAKNLQPFHFIVVSEPAALDDLSKSYPAPFLREAPVVVVICVEPSKGWVREQHDGKNYCEMDAAIAIDHMTLAATDLGLGTCWVAAFDPEMVSAVMGLPAAVSPIAMLPIGHPSIAGREKKRKPLDELVRYEHW